jgi:hypothetical protein
LLHARRHVAGAPLSIRAAQAGRRLNGSRRLAPVRLLDAAPPPSVAVRVLAVTMVAWEPLSLAVTASAALPRLVLYGLPAFLLLGCRLLVAGVGLGAGRALWSGGPDAERLAQGWLALATLTGVLTACTPYFSVNRLPGTAGLLVGFLLVWNGLWFVYLQARQRTRSVAPSA